MASYLSRDTLVDLSLVSVFLVNSGHFGFLKVLFALHFKGDNDAVSEIVSNTHTDKQLTTTTPLRMR